MRRKLLRIFPLYRGEIILKFLSRLAEEVLHNLSISFVRWNHQPPFHQRSGRNHLQPPLLLCGRGTSTVPPPTKWEGIAPTIAPPTKWERTEGRVTKPPPAFICQNLPFCPLLNPPPRSGGGVVRCFPTYCKAVCGKGHHQPPPTEWEGIEGRARRSPLLFPVKSTLSAPSFILPRGAGEGFVRRSSPATQSCVGGGVCKMILPSKTKLWGGVCKMILPHETKLWGRGL